MNILLVNTNRQRYLAPPPIGLAYISNSLKNEGYTPRLIDLMFSKNPVADIEEEMYQFKPDVIGYSIRNLDNQYMVKPVNQLEEIRGLVNIAKNYNIISILGGTAFTTFPEMMLKYMNADFGICGQGEKSFPAFLKQFKSQRDYGTVPGLVWKCQETIKVNPFSFEGYSGISPDWTVINTKKYKSTFWPNNIVIKTGCKFNCTYCDSFATQGNEIYPRKINDILNEIQMAKQISGMKVFFFSDPCISYPLDYAKELFKAIIDSNLKIQFCTTIEPVSNCFDNEFFSLYKKAGGIFAILGTETLSPKMLKAYQKPFNLDDILQWSKIAEKNRVKFGFDLLFGGPGEDMETIKETIDNLPLIEFSLLNYSIGLRILPKTNLEEISIKEGIIKKREDLFFPKFYVSNKLKLSIADEYIKKELKTYSKRSIKMIPVLIKNKIAKEFGIVLN